MLTRNAKIFHIGLFIFWFLMAIYFAHKMYVLMYVKPVQVWELVERGEKELQTLEIEYCSDPAQAAYDPETCSKYDL